MFYRQTQAIKGQGKNKPIFSNYQFLGVVFDEFHYAKNANAKRTVYANAIAKNALICLGLTGTPVLNRPYELVSQLDILGRLEEFGGFWFFVKRYCNAHQEWVSRKYVWNFKGANHLNELNEKLRAICYVRREKITVLNELPSKQRSVVPLDIDNRKEYQQVEKDLIKWLIEQKGKRVLIPYNVHYKQTCAPYCSIYSQNCCQRPWD